MTADAREEDVRLYTMGDAGYFLGAVALVNSLRLTGHRQRITFLDLGLTPGQRQLLSTECEIVDLENTRRDHPYTFQPYPAALDASGTCVIIDSDVIVTASLSPLFSLAHDGKIVGFADNFRRRCPEWEQLFELRAPLATGDPYVNSGLLAFDATTNRAFLDRWWKLCRSLRVEHPPNRSNPTGFADQDALNALLMSEYRDARVIPDDPRFAIGHRALHATEVTDVDALTCTIDGHEVLAVHATSQPKPWSPRARFLIRRSAYVTCLRRCLSGPQLAIALPNAQLPSWLRNTQGSELELKLMQGLAPIGRAAYKVKSSFVKSPAGSEADPSTRDDGLPRS